MGSQEVIDWLIDYGWIYCPEALEVECIETEYERRTVDLNSDVIQAALKAAQRAFEPEIREGRVRARMHRVDPRDDGKAAEGWEWMVGLERCGMPDHVIPFDTREGRYGPGCIGRLRMAHRFGNRFDNDDSKIVRRNLIEHVMGMELEIGEGPREDAHFYEVIQNQDGSVLARHQVQQGVSCSQTMGWYDPRSFGSIGLKRGVVTHEVLHGYGVFHTTERDPNGQRATMHPILNEDTQSRHGRLVKPDRDLLRGVGYNVTDVPRDIDNEPNPEPDPDAPQGPRLDGAILRQTIYVQDAHGIWGPYEGETPLRKIERI